MFFWGFRPFAGSDVQQLGRAVLSLRCPDREPNLLVSVFFGV